MKKIFCVLYCFIFAIFLSGCDLSHEDKSGLTCIVSVEYENNRVFGTVKYFNYENFTKDGLVLFDLYPNKMQNSNQEITIESVFISGEKANFNTDKNAFYLQVCVQNLKSDITVQFSTRLNEGTGRLNSFENGANFAYFFPHIVPIDENGEFLKYDFVGYGDPFFNAFCDFEAHITLPSTFTLACGGSALYCEPKGEKTTYGYLLKNAKTFAFCINQNYSVVSKKLGNKRVNYYYYNDLVPESQLNNIVLALEFFEESVGEYAYGDFTVAQTNFKHGGMEYPAFCMVSDNLQAQDYTYAIIHETAHQYFPIAVDFNQCENAYFDEGFAEYLTMKFFEKHDKRQFFDRIKLIKATVSAFNRAVSSGKTGFKSGAKRQLKDFCCAYEYYVTTYCKGFLAFYETEKQLTEQKFFKVLRKFYKNKLFKNSCESEFFKSFNASGKKVKNIFLKNLA